MRKGLAGPQVAVCCVKMFAWTFNIIFANVLLLEMFVHLENNFFMCVFIVDVYTMSSVVPGAWFHGDFIGGA